ncbi:YdcF family protein [Candidatus Uhrbacteria bacterium]|jgi:vancomycin permeability regulator SanA|nr:YdcF family protein [Candidatus Uhrbacteria bacterium]
MVLLLVFLNKLKRFFAAILLLCVLFFAPRMVVGGISSKRIVSEGNFDIALILGAHVDSDGLPTPLLKERLEAGILLYENGMVERLVVSNTESAALVMMEYLTERNVPEDSIILDTTAVVTTDSCDTDSHEYLIDLSVVFVSQDFHLPRAIYQCNKLGIDGYGFPAELSGSIDRSQYSWGTKVSVRTQRFVRESGLTWLAVLGIYK